MEQEKFFSESGNQLSELFKKNTLVLVVFLLVIVSIFAYFWNPVVAPFLARYLEKPEGEIILSLYPTSGEVFQDIYAYSFTANNVARLGGAEAAHKFGSDISPDGSYVAYSMRTADDQHYQIYITARGEDGSLGIPERITSSPIDKSNPKWAPNGQSILFNEDPESSYSITEWSIAMTDLSGNEKSLGTGAFAQWFPDGRYFVYLKEDGVYIHDLSSKIDTILWRIVGGESRATMQIRLSDDGRYLAIPDQYHEELTLIEIEDVASAKAQLYRQYSVSAFWPVFSPDNNFIALEVVDKDPTNPITPINQRLGILQIKTGDLNIVADLNDYEQEALWVDDWVETTKEVSVVSTAHAFGARGGQGAPGAAGGGGSTSGGSGASGGSGSGPAPSPRDREVGCPNHDVSPSEGGSADSAGSSGSGAGSGGSSGSGGGPGGRDGRDSGGGSCGTGERGGARCETGGTGGGSPSSPGGGGGYTFTVDLKVSDNGYIDPVRYDAPVGNPFVPSGNDYVVTWLTNDTSTVNAGRPYCTRSGDNPVGNWSGRTQVNKSGAVNFNNVSDGLYTHTYSCTFLGQTASDSVTVDVGGFVATSDPNLSLVAVPSILNRGQSTRLTWEAVDAGSCMLTGTNGDSWSGTSGEELSSPITEQTLFTLTCDGGTTQASVIVNINPSFEEF